jgi:hypothetical protein
MSQRFLAWMLAAILAAAGALPAAAETVDPEPLKPIEPPSSLPRAQRGDKTQNLDRLFAALKVAPDDESAKYIENRIWAIWLASSSDTANLLMGRAKSAADGKDFDLAIRLLTAVIDIRPDFTEAWNRRATVYYTKKTSAARSPTSTKCWRASRAISARSRDWGSSCRSSATTSAPSTRSAVHSPSTRTWSAFPIWSRS